ncbi:MAG: hypothetical protein KJ626_01425 [Verrucomicrobia bacterium]|nr:hypothetical protein [Verrucomicrobiota bacterium]
MDQSLAPIEFADSDIFFECPSCAKGLAIDRRGAGLMITCPDCGTRMQVPVPDDLDPKLKKTAVSNGHDEHIRALQHAVAATKTQAETLAGDLTTLRRRRQKLEKSHSENLDRFEQIHQQLVLIQNAIDRIIPLIQDAVSGEPEGD